MSLVLFCTMHKKLVSLLHVLGVREQSLIDTSRGEGLLISGQMLAGNIFVHPILQHFESYHCEDGLRPFGEQERPP